MFLLRRMTPYFDGRTYRSDKVQKAEWLYKELVALKKKLREPISPGPVAIVRRYELLPDGKDLHGEPRIRFARLRLAELKDYMTEKEQSVPGAKMGAGGLTRRFQPTRKKRGRLNRSR